MIHPEHPGALQLQRLALGEGAPPEVEAHLATCAGCQARAERVLSLQRGFEKEIGFERFAAGVERAAREQRPAPRRPVLAWAGAGAVALAAGLALFVAEDGQRLRGGATARLKGGASVEVVVAEAPLGTQRLAGGAAAAPEPLGPEDRVRIGIVPGEWHFALVLSIDERGEVTPAYASGDRSLGLTGDSPQFLPDSLSFTGQGLERLVVLLSDRALEVDRVAFQLRRRYAEAGGDLTRLAPLDVPGEQFHRTFVRR